MSADQQLSLLAIVSSLPLHATVFSCAIYNVHLHDKGTERYCTWTEMPLSAERKK